MTRIQNNIPTAEVVAALFQLAHDLKNAGGDGTDPRQLQNDLRSAGDTVWQSLVAMNNGRGPDGKIGR
jgi:hypothetical protein